MKITKLKVYRIKKRQSVYKPLEFPSLKSCRRPCHHPVKSLAVEPHSDRDPRERRRGRLPSAAAEATQTSAMAAAGGVLVIQSDWHDTLR